MVDPCSICYQELSKANNCVVHPCQHEFCKECIYKLKASNKFKFKCPLCRANIVSVFNDENRIINLRAFESDSDNPSNTSRLWNSVCKRIFIFVLLSLIIQVITVLVFLYVVPFLSDMKSKLKFYQWKFHPVKNTFPMNWCMCQNNICFEAEVRKMVLIFQNNICARSLDSRIKP